METDVAQVGSAKKKETSKRNAARKKPQKIVSDFSKSEDEIDFEVEEIAAAPESGKKGGRKAAGNAKVGKPPTATKKRGPAAKKQQQPQGLGQKLLTEMLKPAESSPQKKVRKMRASPFSRKSVSKLGELVLPKMKKQQEVKRHHTLLLHPKIVRKFWKSFRQNLDLREQTGG